MHMFYQEGKNSNEMWNHEGLITCWTLLLMILPTVFMRAATQKQLKNCYNQNYQHNFRSRATCASVFHAARLYQFNMVGSGFLIGLKISSDFRVTAHNSPVSEKACRDNAGMDRVSCNVHPFILFTKLFWIILQPVIQICGEELAYLENPGQLICVQNVCKLGLTIGNEAVEAVQLRTRQTCYFPNSVRAGDWFIHSALTENRLP